jgi:hypothetical protein
MADLASLSELRTLVRQRADMQNSQFVTDDEVDSYINHSWAELYDILVSKSAEDYFLNTHTITLTSGTTTYDLPSDFYKARGVDLTVGSDTIPIRRYNWAERNQGTQYNLTYNYRYRIQGNSIVFNPQPNGSNTVSLYYIPSPRKMQSVAVTGTTAADPAVITVGAHSFVAGDEINLTGFLPAAWNVTATVASVTSTTITTDLDASAFAAATTLGVVESRFNFYSGWDEYVIVSSAILCLIKEEADVQTLQVIKEQLRQRIESMAEDRDVGEPLVVTDVRSYFTDLDSGLYG